jgi:transposase
MLDMEEQFMIRHLINEGVSISEISRKTGHDRKTVRKYKLQKKPVKYKKRPPKGSILDPYKDHIKARLELYDLSAVVLLKEIKKIGYPGSYTIVKDFVRTVKKSKRIPAEYRYETGPGIQAQVDWSEIDEIIIDGQKKTLYCFSMVLGFSRGRYTKFTLDVKTETFILSHINAFNYFGGVTKEILYDNTKNVVIKRAIRSSDSQWNSLFEDFFKYFGFIPRLCKPGKRGAKTKGKIERVIGYVKNNFYLGRDYDSIQDLNNQALEWLDEVNRLPHGTTKIPPFDRLEEEKLMPIDDKSPYQIVRTEYRKISKDCFFSYMGNLYSVPWKYAGLQAELRIQNRNMKVSVNGKNICEHVCREGSGNVVRVSEHFEGLLKEIMGRNRDDHEKRIRKLKVVAPVVEKRPLVEYDVFSDSGGDINE